MSSAKIQKRNKATNANIIGTNTAKTSISLEEMLTRVKKTKELKHA